MSGGAFDYKQWAINDIAESIQCELDRQGQEIPRDQRYHNDDWYEKYPDDKFYPTYSKEVAAEMQAAVDTLKKASIYANRIDYFLSGDSGEESFLKRLKEELGE